MVIIIPTLLNVDINECIKSIYKNIELPINIYLSMGYHNFAKACNNGFNNTIHKDSEWVLFLNDDIVVDNNFIKYMLNTAGNLDADIVGAKLLYPNKRIQHVGVYFNDIGMPYHIRINESNDIIDDDIVPAVTGACMMIKSYVFKEIGGFDTNYINCFEDVDLCLNARKRGYKIALCGNTNITHYEKSTRVFNENEFKYNKGVLINKWKIDIKYLSTVL